MYMNGNCVIYLKCSYLKYIYIYFFWFPGTNREGLLYPYTCMTLEKHYRSLKFSTKEPECAFVQSYSYYSYTFSLPQYYIIRRPLQATNTTTMNQLCSVSTLIMIFSRNLRSSHVWVDSVGLFYRCQLPHAQQNRSSNETNSLIQFFTILSSGYQKSDSSFAINKTTRYERSRYNTTCYNGSPRVTGNTFIQCRPHDPYNGSAI